ncbi:hypothetical protein Tco_0107064 [Tanacetum coccineum]
MIRPPPPPPATSRRRQKSFPADFSGEHQMWSSRPDLPDPHTHSPSLATTMAVTIATPLPSSPPQLTPPPPPSLSSSSPLHPHRNHHTDSPPPSSSRHHPNTITTEGELG